MYKSIITLKKDLSQDKIQQIHELCDKAYDNRCGKLTNQSNDPFVLHYESKDPCGALMLGQLNIADLGILSHFTKWDFLDEEDGAESGNVLELYYSKKPHLFAI
ncbi:MAG: hypothetical protein LBU60_04110 [Clostridiales bacterium]|jgi:hypothetical protein|nr:hypothetical protein [Clostridiales bacterium]